MTEDLTNTFGTLYHPVKALLIYKRGGNDYHEDFYIESYDMDRNGRPSNAHPLSVRESHALAKALKARDEKTRGFLNPKGLLPKNVLYLQGGNDGLVVWHTPAQAHPLLFAESLNIPSGMAAIPHLVWKATKSSLQIFACATKRIGEKTSLCHAPFFNIYADGRVCMGNVQVRIPQDAGLEQFIELWQQYFFNSYFTHLIGGHQSVKGNIVQLWQELATRDTPFPADVLIPTRFYP